MPSDTFPRNLLEIPHNIKLVDPEFHVPRQVDLIIGSGTSLSLFSIGQINLSKNSHDLYSHKARLRGVIAGEISRPIRKRRVGGRLKNSNLAYSQKYPILLPSHNEITDMIVKQIHMDNFHSGVQTT